MTIRFGTSGGRGLSLYEMSFGFKFIREGFNEHKIIPGAEEFAGMSVKGNDPAEDGVIARLFSEEAVAAHCKTSRDDIDGLKFSFADSSPTSLVTLWHGAVGARLG